MGKETYEAVVPGLKPPQEEEKNEQATDNASAVEPKKEVVQPTQQTESVQPTATTTPNTTDNTDAKQSSDVAQSEGKVVTPYTVTPPPEQPDYDAIEKGIEDKDKEQRKADANRRRSRAIVSAVGDGLTALSNLYFTTRYAPNMNTGRGELSAKNVERWDKYVKARDAKLAEYKKTAIERADKKYENDYTRWKDEATFAQNKRKQDMEEAKSEFEMALKRAKDERDSERNYWLNLKTQKEIDGIEYDNRISEIDAKYEEDIKKAELAYKRAQERQASTGATLNQARTSKVKKEEKYVGANKGSSSNKGNYILAVTDKNGVRTSEKIYPGDPRYKQLSIQLDESDDDSSQGDSPYKWSNEGSYGNNTYVTSNQVKNGGKKRVQGFNGN